MDRQSAMQSGGAGAGCGAAVHEWFYASGGRQAPEQAAVVDGAFLMDLLEDAPGADQAPEDVDRLSCVIRSLEAEIGGGGWAAPPADGGSTVEHVPAGDVGCEGLEECMLSDDFYSAPGPCVAEAPFEYCWTEVPPAAGHDMGGWYVDGDGLVAGYEFREQCYYGYNDSPHVEHVYSPLWE
ncbi:hypothetical protein PAHAL_4G120600 [Panicum hallii]|jgi:hypothetical protein|uniref:Uncharacterized protein n=1 Tax=Panicum hallii TaxID=206008 RepID=A0A2S3HJ33_9POAL|nr:uncharacterized protein LOC112889760 [Panicum hallii]PAN23817.1 hypothetical protein PAHAL_4G120600 [Panicum hallii]